MIIPDDIFSRNRLFWGAEKQQTLAERAMLVAGLGGLGGVVAELLVRAGIGTLIILDQKTIDEPDLNRQILYTTDDLGKRKVDVAFEKLSAMTRRTKIIPLNITIEKQHFPNIIAQYPFDGIADCLDNYSSRFILETLLTERQFMVHGGVRADYGQVTTIVPSNTSLLQELFRGAEEETSPIPVCPQIVCCISSLMVNEILKNLWHEPQLLNQLLIVELSDFTFSKIQLAPYKGNYRD